MITGHPWAELRVYDHGSGADVVAPTRQQAETPPPAAMVPDHATRAAEQPDESPLGHAFIFITVDSFGPILAANIKKAMAIPGLYVKVYAEQLEPSRYFEMMMQAPEEIGGISFQVDNRNYKAYRFNIKKYPTIYYVDGDGSRRYYDAQKEFDKFLRHVERMAQTKGRQ